MLNYINNNLVLINEYQNLYFQEINIDKLIEGFRTEDIIMHNGFDYGRFRVFIDSCSLLLNKEKLNNYCKNRYSFREFIKEVEKVTYLKDYFEFIKQEPLTSDISNICLYYSFENKKKNPWVTTGAISVIFTGIHRDTNQIGSHIITQTLERILIHIFREPRDTMCTDTL